MGRNDTIIICVGMIAFAIVAVFAPITTSKPSPSDDPLPVDVQIQNDFLQKSILANSSDAIVYGNYRVVKNQADLIRQTWRVEHNGETLFTGPMIEAMEFAFRKSEGAERE